MAAPQGQPHPSRYLAVLVVLIAGLYALVFFTGPDGTWREKASPRLGLDLVGGTTVTLIAKTPDGKAPSQDRLEEARNIIENRVNGLGVAEPEVVTEGTSNITVMLAGESNDQIKQIGQPAQLRFRRVLKAVADVPGGVVPSAAPSPNPSASPSPSPKPGTSASVSPSPTASGGTGGYAPTPSTTPTPTPTPTPSTSESPAPADGVGTQRPTEASVLAKFSPQAKQAVQQAPGPEALVDPAVAKLLEPAKALTPAEVAVLPNDWQLKVPQIDCQKLNKRPAGSIEDANEQVISCDGGQKLLLDKAKVLGTDVKDADFSFGTGGQGGGAQGWRVSISFKSSGQEKWTNLTREALGQAEEDQKRVAIVLDNETVSSPTIQSVIPGDAEITGSFTKADVQTLASQLRYGALPLTFEQGEANSISATLGTAQLRAGLLAAAIGMLLVAVYAFFYYRLLGSVIFLSLILSAILVFASLILLGRSIGFTLTLAGIAGFIVSLGVAADSFVIYFERLKDEIRDGRSPRSAIPRAWVRARRTIISANAISIMCAGTLYFLAVGPVKGFAFALGMSTILDLVIVFLFRHPIMTMLANTKAFLSPRVSGLGRVLDHDDEPAAQPRLTRSKEA